MRITALIVLLAASSSAIGQPVTTVDYRTFLTGSYSYLPDGYTAPPGPFDDPPTLLTLPYAALLTASFTFKGSVASGSLIPTAFSFDLQGLNGVPGFAFSGSGSFPELCYDGYVPNVCVISPVISNGSVAGVTFDWGGTTSSPLGALLPGNIELTINPPFTYYTDLWGYEGIGTCQDLVHPGGTYIGSTIDPCTIDTVNAYGADWTVSVMPAPEIDAAGSSGALALLLGTLMIMRSGHAVTRRS